MKISVRVTPRSSKNSASQMANGALKVNLTASPVGGKANSCLIKFLSEYFSTPRNKIKIVSGLTSRNKIIEIGN